MREWGRYLSRTRRIRCQVQPFEPRWLRRHKTRSHSRPPAVKDRSWPFSDLDFYILNDLELAGFFHSTASVYKWRPEQAFQRTIYLPVVRSTAQPGPAELRNVFDFTQPAEFAGQRAVTTVPTQALFLINSPVAPVRSRGESGMMISDLMPKAVRHHNDADWTFCAA